MTTEQPATYEIFMADLTLGRGATRSIVTPYTDELQVATFLVDAWMMKLMPLELVGEFVKRTNKKLWSEFTGEEEEVAAAAAPTPAAAPPPPVPATPIFGGGVGFGSSASFGGGFGSALTAPAPGPSKLPEPPKNETIMMDLDDDVEMEAHEDWDSIEFTTQDLQEIRDSILNALKKESARRLFFEMLPKATRFPYLCVKKGSATHADVMLEMLRRNGAISF